MGRVRTWYSIVDMGRVKSELYKQEQEEIVNKLLTILDLEHNNPFILYHLDNNKELQQKIMDFG